MLSESSLISLGGVESMHGSIRIERGESGGVDLILASRLGTRHLSLTGTGIYLDEYISYMLHADGERLFFATDECFIAFIVDFAQGSLTPLRLRDEQDVSILLGQGLMWTRLYALERGELLLFYEGGLLILDAEWDVRWHVREPFLGYWIEKIEADLIWLVHELAGDISQSAYRIEDGAEVHYSTGTGNPTTPA